ncbi:hypothetical protein [Nostoc sp. CCY0012]|jgi:hypothetical protein|uniref:hypothetical protein n=1 Tax=Nostoc sp. CCY0012 TaxID=1056123 RepID=UPI0039C6EB98
MILVLQRLNLSSVQLTSVMGFADLLIAEIAADYSVPVERLFSLPKQLVIADKHQKTRLALEDIKAMIFQILSGIRPKVTRNSVGEA